MLTIPNTFIFKFNVLAKRCAKKKKKTKLKKKPIDKNHERQIDETSYWSQRCDERVLTETR